MKIKATIVLEYTLSPTDVDEFRSRVLEHIEENSEEDPGLTLDDIPLDATEKFLDVAIQNIISDQYSGYGGGNGVCCDDYFHTISLDYCEEDISDLIVNFANEILTARK